MLLSLLFIIGCKNIIDLKPVNSIYDEAFWKTEADAYAALAGNYSLLRTALADQPGSTGPRYYLYGDVRAREFADNLDWIIQQVHNNVMNGFYVGEMNNWALFYKVIAMSNLIIQKVPVIDDAKFNNSSRNKVLGEALYLRAFTYFYMVRLWGDVPLVTTVVDDPTSADNQIARVNQNLVLNQCIADLNQAKGLLEFGYVDNNERAVRANKGSLFALLAHIYMWMDNAEAAELAADEVIDKGGYKLVDTAAYTTLYKGKSLEGIFELNMSAADNEAYSTTGIGEKTLRIPYNNASTPIWWVNIALVNNLYPEKSLDKRRKRFFDFLNTDRPIVKKYANVVHISQTGLGGVLYESNMIIFRLSDILLLKAEALSKQGKNIPARELLNIIKNRAGLADYTGLDKDLYREIILERMRELFCEGHTFFDLVRSKLLSEFNSKINAQDFNAGGWLLPVDPVLFKRNFKMEQNAYWVGKI